MSTFLGITVGALALLGVLLVVVYVVGRVMMRGSPHHGDANRLRTTVELSGPRGKAGATVAIRALDDLLTLARRHPTEPMVQRDLLAAADHAMTAIPDELPADLIESLFAHAATLVGNGPRRSIAVSLAMFLRTRGATRAHTAGARELHERLQVVAPAIGKHHWPNPHQPPPRPAPYRR